MYADKEYIIALRHELHKYPEVGLICRGRSLSQMRKKLRLFTTIFATDVSSLELILK